ncbi:hypothetical protein AAHE18_08G208400 [Arachis hypogaea]
MSKQKCSPIIIQFQRAVKKKLRSILHYLLRRMHYSSSSSVSKQRWWRLFNNNTISFKSFIEDEQIKSDRMEKYRTTIISYASEDDDDDDINQRAEVFIANFRRQLSLERRVCYWEPKF